MWYQSLRNLQMFHLLSGDLKSHHDIIFNDCPTGSEAFRVSPFRLGLWSETTQATLPAVGMSPDHRDVQQVDAVKNEVDGISWIWWYLNHGFPANLQQGVRTFVQSETFSTALYSKQKYVSRVAPPEEKGDMWKIWFFQRRGPNSVLARCKCMG